MLSDKGFDLWADGYDESVGLCEEANEYPFAGYKRVLGTIYDRIRCGDGKWVLDVGIGTGVLAKRLYDAGYHITGVDFSGKMLEIAGNSMSAARLIQHDFSQGLPQTLKEETFDFITCTYAIHHLDDGQKIELIKALLAILAPGGTLYIGDVAFETKGELAQCRAACGEDWDEDEIYPVAEILQGVFPDMQFEKISFCAGIMTFTK